MAILLVIITHYSSYYAPGFYKMLLRDYAGFFVSIFFVLSGYGLYHSFLRLGERYNTGNSGGLSLRLVGSFYWHRAKRIYPLFWLSIFSASFLLTGWNQLHELSLRTVATYLAFPTVIGPGFIWFIPALIQCYLLAPLFYLLLKRLKPRMYMIMIVFLTAIFMIVSYYYLNLIGLVKGFGIPDPQSLFYRSVFLSNVLLFAVGMAMPILRKSVKPYVNGVTTIAFFIAMLASMYIVRDPDLLFSRSHFLLFPLFIISVSCFCLSAIAANRILPFSKPLVFQGVYSYPMYLFHWQYFSILALAGLITENRWQSAMITTALFPAFLLACVILQQASNQMAGLLSGLSIKRAPVVKVKVQ